MRPNGQHLKLRCVLILLLLQRNQYSYGYLLVISGYKWDYTLYKWGYTYL
jgi:hypothetical protein